MAICCCCLVCISACKERSKDRLCMVQACHLQSRPRCTHHCDCNAQVGHEQLSSVGMVSEVSLQIQCPGLLAPLPPRKIPPKSVPHKGDTRGVPHSVFGSEMENREMLYFPGKNRNGHTSGTASGTATGTVTGTLSGPFLGTGPPPPSQRFPSQVFGFRFQKNADLWPVVLQRFRRHNCLSFFFRSCKHSRAL